MRAPLDDRYAAARVLGARVDDDEVLTSLIEAAPELGLEAVRDAVVRRAPKACIVPIR